jgi:hypothetical protein
MNWSITELLIYTCVAILISGVWYELGFAAVGCAFGIIAILLLGCVFFRYLSPASSGAG